MFNERRYASFLNKARSQHDYEAKFTTLEEERPDALEMAAKAHEEGKEKA